MDSSNQTQKIVIKETEVTDSKDIISTLHESILGQILSFLPTIEAIQTCVLSQRWIHVWKSITSLCFSDSLPCYGKILKKEQFVNFVNKVLLHHLANSSITNFSLCLTRYRYDSKQVSEWISTVLDRRIQKLHIQYAGKVQFSSHSFFKCDTLVQLDLKVRCTLNVPIYACFPNLQNLNISGVRLESDSSIFSEDIVLNFPVLKVFEARACEWLTMQGISIQAPLLEKFSLALCYSSISNESCKSSIKIFAPCLKEFSYEGDLELDIILLDSSSVCDASVVIVVDEDKKDMMESLGFQAHKLLSQIHQVELLKLLFYKVLMHSNDIFTHLPTFGRLTYLQLNEVTDEALSKLLHNSPILNTLVLLNGVSHDSNKDAMSYASSVPHCFLSSLRVFQFNGFNVHEHEISLVKFVMGNAAVLERMIISAAFWLRYSDIDMEKVKDNIFSFPKCCSRAIIEFSDVNGSSTCSGPL
ncbi:F-box/FBD/LRR-repeat protein At3g14710-like [Arachis stenosperma]|uniref:F-box/FBD/LRR-repeat protein At3g14710-like n=1 Tax=Arachis stenosperma TaxID=217475 RepID=UPI0025AC214D|nr:F-box/FBD/LRR-repeat protein At3g14710-like [Arachis stenosperma]XP_057724224.1 F-box/FBD/LRR-repeat protein At3g14710-like [Arachis stenosperma]XP_057724226.1 F-box/FBD/LRR-repeat protein At3g14710-like [Arachis stenosperma]